MGVIEASDRAWKVIQMKSEKQGAAEWLRGIIGEYEASGAISSCSTMAKMFGIDCEDVTCRGCRIKMMTTIADRIDAERALPDGMEWPRFEDGELVKVGDEVEFEGEAAKVLDVAFSAVRFSLGVNTATASRRVYCDLGESVNRLTPKVLDADGVPIEVGDTVYCDGKDKPLMVIHTTDSTKVTLVEDNVSYFTVKPSRLTHEPPDSWEKLEEDANLGCRDYCEKYRLEECDYNMRVHILARAKKLAGIEEEAQR